MPKFPVIDRSRCTDCESCLEICPEVFEMGKRFAMVRQPIIPEEQTASILDTAADCPADAIKIEIT